MHAKQDEQNISKKKGTAKKNENKKKASKVSVFFCIVHH
jgi:hypothetical protein